MTAEINKLVDLGWREMDLSTHIFLHWYVAGPIADPEW